MDGSGASYVPSLTVVLTQAIRSGDNSLLDYCLNTSDLRAIDATIERFPASQIAPLLAAVARKCEVSPSRSPALMPWVRSVIKHHMARLISTADLLPCVAGVHRITETRLAIFSKLMRLSGRFDLLVKS